MRGSSPAARCRSEPLCCFRWRRRSSSWATSSSAHFPGGISLGSSAWSSASSRFTVPAFTSWASEASSSTIPDDAARLHGRADLHRLLLADHVADGPVHDQHLDGGHHPARVGARQQPLRDDRAQRLGEHRAHLVLLVGRERADDPVHRAHRVVGVQRREHEVAGLGGGHRERDRLAVAQLADHDHVRVLAQGRAQRARERLGVALHVALVHDAALRRVQVLDRVLDREDVLGALLVDQVHERRHRRRLAARRRAGDQHHALVEVGELRERVGQAQVFERRRLQRDAPEGRVEPAAAAGTRSRGSARGPSPCSRSRSRRAPRAARAPRRRARTGSASRRRAARASRRAPRRARRARAAARWSRCAGGCRSRSGSRRRRAARRGPVERDPDDTRGCRGAAHGPRLRGRRPLDRLRGRASSPGAEPPQPAPAGAPGAPGPRRRGESLSAPTSDAAGAGASARFSLARAITPRCSSMALASVASLTKPSARSTWPRFLVLPGRLCSRVAWASCSMVIIFAATATRPSSASAGLEVAGAAMGPRAIGRLRSGVESDAQLWRKSSRLNDNFVSCRHFSIVSCALQCGRLGLVLRGAIACGSSMLECLWRAAGPALAVAALVAPGSAARALPLPTGLEGGCSITGCAGAHTDGEATVTTTRSWPPTT